MVFTGNMCGPQKRKVLMKYMSAVNIAAERPAHGISLQGFAVYIDATTEVGCHSLLHKMETISSLFLIRPIQVDQCFNELAAFIENINA
jgi:hypothetical protein